MHNFKHENNWNPKPYGHLQQQFFTQFSSLRTIVHSLHACFEAFTTVKFPSWGLLGCDAV